MEVSSYAFAHASRSGSPSRLHRTSHASDGFFELAKFAISWPIGHPSNTLPTTSCNSIKLADPNRR